MTHKLTEDAIEQMAIERLQSLGFAYRHGPALALDGDTPERASYEDVWFCQSKSEPFDHEIVSHLDN